MRCHASVSASKGPSTPSDPSPLSCSEPPQNDRVPACIHAYWKSSPPTLSLCAQGVPNLAPSKRGSTITLCSPNPDASLKHSHTMAESQPKGMCRPVLKSDGFRFAFLC